MTPAEISGFVDEMYTGSDWEPVPILVAGIESGGPADHASFKRTLARMEEAAGAIVAYRTNPHVDQRERAAEVVA